MSKLLKEYLSFSITIYLMSGLVIISIIGFVLLLFSYSLPLIISTKFYRLNNINQEIINKSSLSSRKWVTAAQFVFTIFLIISTLVVNKQYQIMIEKDLGFNAENVIRTSFFSDFGQFEDRETYMAEYKKREDNFQMLVSEIENNPNIITYGMGDLLSPYPMSFKKLNSELEFNTENILIVSPGFEKTLGLRMKSGRFFDWKRDESRGEAVVVNEAALKKYNIHDISIERIINKSWSNKGSGNRIIGVVEDFNYEHVASKVEPLIMYYFKDSERDFFIKVQKGNEQNALAFLNELHNKINPGLTFSYSFINDEIRNLYSKEKRLSYIYILFTLITIFISSIGLLAFAYSSTQKRTKEIGVRKVNGAKVSEILAMLNKDFIKWVAIAFVIACPIAYYAMNKWLENFAYKTTLSWWIFALAGVIALGIALLTVSWHSWRAATRNPVEALRYE